MNRMGRLLAGAAAGLLALAAARADTIETFTNTIAPTSVPFSDTFSLPGFDSALGTLDAITITLDASGSADVVVDNTTSSSQSFSDANATIPVSLTGPGGLTTTVSLSAGPFSGTVPPTTTVTLPGSPGSVTGTITVPSADFSLFEGMGLIVGMDVNAGSGTFSGTSSPGVFFGGSSTLGALTSISYSFSPASTTIPEPATVALFGGALLVMGSLLKKTLRAGKRT
jgi:hypothetical protein